MNGKKLARRGWTIHRSIKYVYIYIQGLKKIQSIRPYNIMLWIIYVSYIIPFDSSLNVVKIPTPVCNHTSRGTNRTTANTHHVNTLTGVIVYQQTTAVHVRCHGPTKCCRVSTWYAIIMSQPHIMSLYHILLCSTRLNSVHTIKKNDMNPKDNTFFISNTTHGFKINRFFEFYLTKIKHTQYIIIIQYIYMLSVKHCCNERIIIIIVDNSSHLNITELPSNTTIYHKPILVNAFCTQWLFVIQILIYIRIVLKVYI